MLVVKPLRFLIGLVAAIAWLIWHTRASKTYEVTTEAVRGVSYMHSALANRYGSSETWRPPTAYGAAVKQESRGIFLMLQTSAQSAWKFVPVHSLTTLRDFENHAVYSDAADMIGDTEIIDTLAEIPAPILEGAQLEAYRRLRALRDQRLYLDLESMQFSGHQLLDKFKPLSILFDAYKKAPHHDWYVLAQDRTFLFTRALRSFLGKLNPNHPYYLGSAIAGLSYTFAHGGSGIILSRAAMKQAFGNQDSAEWVRQYLLQAQIECCGDYMVALYLKRVCDIDLDVQTSAGHFQGNPIWKAAVGAKNWCSPVLALEPETPKELQMLYEYEHLHKEEVLYVDLYLDFVKPYLPTFAQNQWDNQACDIEFGPESEWSESVLSCQQACLMRPDCLSYRHDSYTRYCGLSTLAMGLGRPIVAYADEPDTKLCAKYNIRCSPRAESEHVVSDWMLPRIQALRRTATCDPLVETSEGQPGTLFDQTEGWWRRQ